MKIKELIKNKRIELKESQEDFGKRFGLSHAAISDLERGVTLSITEHMMNFLFGNPCEHANRTFRKTVIVKCLDCGEEKEENMKI